MKRIQQLYLGVVGPRPRKAQRGTPHQEIVRAAREREAHEKRKNEYIDPRVAAAMRGILRRIGQ
jgi:hypothetical protein